MLKLKDGREELWQWDTGRELTVDAECSEVHFSNKVYGRSVDVPVVDGIAKIPDILLQMDNDLYAWGFVGTPEDGYTKISKVLRINRRNKPADYVFTPPDQTTLAEILDQVKELEQNAPEKIVAEIEKYLAENPITAESIDAVVQNQGKENAGMFLGINTAGEVVPVEAETDVVQYKPQELTVDEQKQARRNIDAQKQVYAVSTGNPWSADDCANAPVRELKLFGASEQAQYSGKNLFDMQVFRDASANGFTIQYLENEDCIVINGTATTTLSVFRTPYLIETGTEDPYTISVEYVSGTFSIPDGGYGVFYTGNGDSADEITNFLDTKFSYDISYKSAINTKNYITGVWFYISGGSVFSNYKIKLQIEKNSEFTSYEPYVGGMPSPNPDYPQDVRNNDMTYTILGKNLLSNNPDNWMINQTIYWGADAATSVMFRDDNKSAVLEINALPNTKYTFINIDTNNYWISRIVECDDKGLGYVNYVFYTSISLNKPNYVFTTSENTTKLYIQLWTVPINEVYPDITNTFISNNPIMLALGSINDEDYEPYHNGGSVTAPELYAIGDVRDEWDAVTGKGIRRIKKIVLTGNSAWGDYNSDMGFHSGNCLDDIYFKQNGHCNFLRVITKEERFQNGVVIGSNNNILYCIKSQFYDSSLPDKGLSNWKAYLNENPMEVYYVTKHPEEFTTEPAPQITTPDGYAQLLPAGDGIAGGIEVEYAIEIEERYASKKLYNDLEKRVAALESNAIGESISLIGEESQI